LAAACACCPSMGQRARQCDPHGTAPGCPTPHNTTPHHTAPPQPSPHHATPLHAPRRSKQRRAPVRSLFRMVQAAAGAAWRRAGGGVFAVCIRHAGGPPSISAHLSLQSRPRSGRTMANRITNHPVKHPINALPPPPVLESHPNPNSQASPPPPTPSSSTST